MVEETIAKNRIDYHDVPSNLPTMNKETMFELIEGSIKKILADCGYHMSYQSNIDILNDLCCDYILKITSSLRTTIDTACLRDTESDYYDELDRVFHQINVPSVANLHQFVCRLQTIKKHTLQREQIQQQQILLQQQHQQTLQEQVQTQETQMQTQ